MTNEPNGTAAAFDDENSGAVGNIVHPPEGNFALPKIVHPPEGGLGTGNPPENGTDSVE